MHSQNVRRFSMWMSCLLLPALAVAQSTLHVPGDYSTIAAAVAAANDGDTVEIAPGTYTESGIQVNTAITIRGAAPNHGAVTLDASSANLFYAFGVDSLRLENLTLQNGLAMANELHPAYGDGGGAVLLVDTDFSASNCCFNDNQVQVRYQASRSIDMVPASGGAVYVAGSGSARLDNCHFTGNGITGNPGDATPGTLFRTGGALAVDGTLEMTACTFSDNYLYLTGDSDTAMGGALAAGSIVASDCSLEGNQIQLHGGTYLSAKGSAVYCAGDQFWQECRFLSNDFTSSGTPYGNVDGSALWGAGAFSASYSLFANNITYFRSSNEYTGGSAVRALTGEISNCTFYGNGSALSSASQGVPTVVAYFATELELGTSIFAQNIDAPVSIPAAGLLDVSCTDVYDNDRGDWSGSLAGLNGVDGNFSADPLFVAPTTEDFTLLPASPCQAANNSCGVVLGCQLTASDADGILLVPAEYPSIAAAVAMAWPGEEVLISSGTYYEHDIPVYAPVTIRGAVADSGAVVVNAQEQGRHFAAYHLAEGLVLKNLTLINGEQSADYALYAQGGSLYLENTELLATNCFFVDNHALYDNGNNYSAYGGAIYSEGAAGIRLVSCAFDRCSIEEDYLTGSKTVHQHGGSICTDGHLTLENCRFRDCKTLYNGSSGTAYGGAISAASVSGSNCLFRKCNLASHYGNGVSMGNIVYTSGLQNWVSCQFLNCINTSPSSVRYGSLLFSEATIACESSTFSGNRSRISSYARDEGGSLFHAANLTLSTCTLHNNASLTSSGYPEVLAYASSSLQIENCLISHNNDAPALLGAGANLDVDCTNIFGNTAGDWSDEFAAFASIDGNISANPVFCDAEAGELGLQAHSPCLSANNSCGVLMGAWPESCASDLEIVFSDPFPYSESGTPATTGDDGVAITLSNDGGIPVDAASLQMRVDYDGDGFDADPREQWYALTGYTSADSMRLVELLPNLHEIGESDVEVQFSASLLGYTQVFSTSIAMHVDRVAPAGVSLAFVEGNTVSATLGFDSSLAADFACYQVLVSSDSTFDASDRIWSLEEDPALATATTTQTTVADLTIASQYWFAIQVIDQVGNLSELSNTVQHFTALTGDIIHVPSDFATIEAAVAASSTGDTIEIAPGVYPVLNVVVGHSLLIRGAVADSGAVVIAGISGRHFDFRVAASGVVLENLCLIGGSANRGGSIQAINVPLEISNCDFLNNQAYSYSTTTSHQCYWTNGGGGAIRSTGSLVMTDCSFYNNRVFMNGDCYEYSDAMHMGGAVLAADVHLQNCRFTSNRVEIGDVGNIGLGGAICASSIDANACYFQSNTLQSVGGACVNSTGSVAFTSGTQYYNECVFTENQTAGPSWSMGGMLCSDSAISAIGCIFAGNHSFIVDENYEGSLVHAETAEINACTVYGNTSETNDAQAYLFSTTSALSIFNSIFYANDDEISNSPTELDVFCTDSYANTLGNWTGALAAFEGTNGNFSLNPAFCNAPVHDFGLQAGSPCLPENNSCAVLIGAMPQGCGIVNSIVFTLPFPSSESGLPIVTGEEGVAITVSSTSDDEVDASSLCMRVDYDGDGFDADAREQWQSLSGYSDDFSIRMEEALAHIDEVSENDIEVEFGARTTAEAELSYSSILMHIDRIAPQAVVQSPLNDLGAHVELHFSASIAEDFASYRIWISSDATIDENDRVWSINEDPALATAATTQTTVTSLVEGIAYWFAVEVLDEAGNVSALSNLVVRTGASGNVLCVPASYASLNDALAASDEGDIILIAAGQYDCSNLQIPHSITIQGAVADSGAVVLDAQNNSRHFRVNNASTSLHLANLCLVNGRSTASWGSSPQAGSIYFAGDSLSAENCCWVNNRSVGIIVWGGEYGDESFYQDAYGGAIFIQSATSAELNECHFYNSACYADNTIARGGAIYSNTPLVLSSCDFIESLLKAGPGEFEFASHSEGAAIYCATGVELDACLFDSNSIDLGYHSLYPHSKGAGVFAEGDVLVDSCLFKGNGIDNASGFWVGQGMNGMAIYTSQLLNAQNSQFVENHSTFNEEAGDPSTATGFALYGGLVELDQCTLHGNAFEDGRIAPSVVSAETSCQITNCILSANTGMNSPASSVGSITVSCTNIYGNSADWVGDLAPFASINGNLSQDPLYADAPDDLHLQTASPCLPGNNSCSAQMGALGEVPDSNILNVPAQFETVSAALSASSAGNIILVAAGQYDCSNLQIPHSIMIQGAVADSGAVVLDAQNNGRHFTVNNAGTSLHLANLCLINGESREPTFGESPVAGSIFFNADILHADNCCWVDNHCIGEIIEYESQDTHEIFYFYQEANGGALFVESATEVSLSDCQFYNSTCVAPSSWTRGGAIYSFSPLTLADCSFVSSGLTPSPTSTTAMNCIAEGGAIYCQSEVSASSCVFSENALNLENASVFSVGSGAGVYATGNVDISNCTFVANRIDSRDNISSNGAFGSAVFCSQTLTADFSQFNTNVAEYFCSEYPADEMEFISAGNALHASSATISNCTFHSNEFVSGDYTSLGTVGAWNELALQNCLFTDNTGIACPVDAPGIFQVSCTDVYGNSADWVGDMAPFAGISGNLSLDPLYADAPEDLRLQAASPCLPENNSCGVQMGALGAIPGGNILNVPVQFETVSAALSASSAGDIILIAAGQYDCSNLQIPHSITIQGAVADSGAVVLDAQNNSRHFRVNNAGTSLHLANLCLINGRSRSNTWGSSPTAGSVHFAGTDLSAENCYWINNRVQGRILFPADPEDPIDYFQNAYGGSVFIESANSAEFTNCHFRNSTATAEGEVAQGGAVFSNTALSLVDCSFVGSFLFAWGGLHDNAHGAGAGVYCSSDVDMEGCEFLQNNIQATCPIANEVQGIGVFATGNANLLNCRFLGNGVNDAADIVAELSGSAVYAGGLLTAQFCEVTANNSVYIETLSASHGLLLYAYEMELENCTVHGNTHLGFDLAQSAVYAENSCELSNCLLSSNAWITNPLECAGTLSISCTNSNGNYSYMDDPVDWVGDMAPFAGINGNLSLDPLYADAPEDLRLQAASPCLPANNSCGVLMGALGAAPEILMVSDLCAVANGEDIFLSWTDPNPALNDSFEIHHGSSQGFVPGPETLVGTTTTTQYTFSPECQDCVGFLRVVAVSQPISELDRSKRRLSASSRRMQE